MSLIADTTKLVVRILRRRTESKIEDVLGEISLDLEGEKEFVTLRIIPERTLDIDEELYACFKDRQKAFERVNWTKLIQVINGTDIEWRERRLISNLCMDQCVKLRVDQGKTKSLKKGRGIRPGCCLSPIQFNPYTE